MGLGHGMWRREEEKPGWEREQQQAQSHGLIDRESSAGPNFKNSNLDHSMPVIIFSDWM